MSGLEILGDRASPRHSLLTASPFGRPSRATHEIPQTPKSAVGQRGFPWTSPVQKLPKFSLWSPAKTSKTKESPLKLTDRLFGYVYGAHPYHSFYFPPQPLVC